jgi:uncharacterized damage-inducible protein DinB
MPQAESALFLDFSQRKLRQLSERISACLDRLEEEDVWVRGGDHENAIGNLVLHLCGNVGQWIGFAIGGRPDTRRRDAEFAEREGPSKTELKSLLENATAEALAVLERLPPERLGEAIAPQGYQVTILEGIYHVIEHFAQHTGQILYATKMLTGRELGFYRHLDRPAPHGETTP